MPDQLPDKSKGPWCMLSSRFALHENRRNLGINHALSKCAKKCHVLESQKCGYLMYHPCQLGICIHNFQQNASTHHMNSFHMKPYMSNEFKLWISVLNAIIWDLCKILRNKCAIWTFQRKSFFRKHNIKFPVIWRIFTHRHDPCCQHTSTVFLCGWIRACCQRNHLLLLQVSAIRVWADACFGKVQ